MTTAMQEMYSDLIQKHIVYTKSGMISEANSLESSIELAEHLIDKETMQIQRAYHQGVVNEISIYRTINPEEYYEQTYGQV